MSWQDLTTRGGNRPSFAGASTSTAGSVAKGVPSGGGRRFRGRLPKGRRGVYKIARQVNAISRRMALDTQIAAFDQNYSNTVTTTGVVQPISNIAMAGATNDRMGNSVDIKSFHIKLAFSIGAGATSNALGRFMVVIDRSSNGATPALADILSAAAVNAPTNYNNKGRFHILIDRTYCLAVGAQDIVVDKLYKKLKIEATYIGTTGLPASSGTNQLYVVMLSDQTGAASPFFNFYSRVKFIP